MLCFLAACSSLQNCATCKDEPLVCDACSSGYTANDDKTQCGGEWIKQTHPLHAVSPFDLTLLQHVLLTFKGGSLKSNKHNNMSGTTFPCFGRSICANFLTCQSGSPPFSNNLLSFILKQHHIFYENKWLHNTKYGKLLTLIFQIVGKGIPSYNTHLP